MIDTGLKHDASYSITVLSFLEYNMDEYKDTVYSYLYHISKALHKKVTVVYEKFVVSFFSYLTKIGGTNNIHPSNLSND